ncbi:MAG: hypothetical protein ACUVS7_09045 [Bryobacteraceae bacterium]
MSLEAGTGNIAGRALILTVGQGSVQDLERTLICPFRRSFETGDWGPEMRNRSILIHGFHPRSRENPATDAGIRKAKADSGFTQPTTVAIERTISHAG